MKEKQTQNPLSREYNYIAVFSIDENNVDFKQLCKKLKKIYRHEDILFVLQAIDSNYSYDYFQPRKKSIEQLKLIKNSDLLKVLDLPIDVELPKELLKSAVDNKVSIIKIEDNDTAKNFADTYGYPHTYLSRMYDAGILGTGMGILYGLIGGSVAAHFASAAIIALLASLIASPIGLGISSVILLGAIVVGCFVGSGLLLRGVGMLIAALDHYQDKSSAELKQQTQPVTGTQEPKPQLTNNADFSSPLGKLPTNSCDTDEDTFTRKLFCKAFLKF